MIYDTQLQSLRWVQCHLHRNRKFVRMASLVVTGDVEDIWWRSMYLVTARQSYWRSFRFSFLIDRVITSPACIYVLMHQGCWKLPTAHNLHQWPTWHIFIAEEVLHRIQHRGSPNPLQHEPPIYSVAQEIGPRSYCFVLVSHRLILPVLITHAYSLPSLRAPWLPWWQSAGPPVTVKSTPWRLSVCCVLLWFSSGRFSDIPQGWFPGTAGLHWWCRLLVDGSQNFTQNIIWYNKNKTKHGKNVYTFLYVLHITLKRSQ